MRLTSIALLCAALVALSMPAASAATAYDDVPSGHWADAAVAATAEQNNFLTFSGTSFHPTRKLSRRVLARALVRAFAPDDEVDPTVLFDDLPVEDPWYRYAALVAKRGWLKPIGGAFLPDAPVTKRTMDRALVLALDLRDAVKGLYAIHEETGERFTLPPYFPYLAIAGNLRFHYNHPSGSADQNERYPWEDVSRADGAYALARAKEVQGGWAIGQLSSYNDITLPAMSNARHGAVQFALAYTGYPYIYAGEWHRKTPDGYCCGAQVHGGFDCSGFLWWTMRAAGNGFSNTHVRPYAGWSLPERASYQMAKATPTDERIARADLRPLDIVLFDSDGGGGGAGGVDHAGLSLGNGWMIHSSGGRAGVTLDRVGDGWWADALVFGRRIA